MNNTLWIIIGIIVVGAIGSFVIFGGGTTQDNVLPPSEPGAPSNELFGKISALSFKDYDGDTVTLSDFSGKPLVINSWAVWCPFCRKELSDFVAVQKEVGDSVVFIAIDRAESLKTAKQFTDEIGITNEMVLLLDPSDSFYRGIGGFSMPETIFVDIDGNIKIHKRGPMNEEEIRKKVREAFGI